MKKVESPVSRALLEVWEAKKAVYEDTKNMTLEQVLAYFEEHSQRLAQDLGKPWAKNSDGPHLGV
jgi:predicted PolB exonuclease-like 3'-5' exonuclease